MISAVPIVCGLHTGKKIYTIIKTTRLSVTEAVPVTGWRCPESRPESVTVNK